MVDSKEWNWELEKNNIWLEPCEESYYYSKKWRREGRQSLLDLGCGLGRHSILFSKEGFKVTATDLSEYAINHLNEWQNREGLDIRTICCDMKKLPFADNAFDCIWSYHVISHTDTEGFQVILKEVQRVLKPNGVIYLTLCSKETYSYHNEFNQRIDDNTVIKMQEGPEKGIPHYFVDLDDILRLFNGFDLRKIRHIDDCYYNHFRQTSKHYYIEAILHKTFSEQDYSA